MSMLVCGETPNGKYMHVHEKGKSFYEMHVHYRALLSLGSGLLYDISHPIWICICLESIQSLN